MIEFKDTQYLNELYKDKRKFDIVQKNYLDIFEQQSI